MFTSLLPADQTLAAIVDANPATTRILERHRLDYCCGGTRTLREACAEQSLDLAALTAELSAAEATETAEWTTMSAVELVNHLEATHHRYLHAELSRLEPPMCQGADFRGRGRGVGRCSA